MQISPLRPQRPKSQLLNQIGGDRRLSVSPGPPSSSMNSSSSSGPPPIMPRKPSHSVHTGSSKTPSFSSRWVCRTRFIRVFTLSGAAAVMRCLLFLNSFLLRSQREARAADIIGHLNTSVRVNFEATKQWPFLPYFKLMLLTKDLFCTGDCNSHSLVTCLSFSNCCCYSAIPFETVYLYYMTRYDLYTLYICSFNIIWLVIQ